MIKTLRPFAHVDYLLRGRRASSIRTRITSKSVVPSFTQCSPTGQSVGPTFFFYPIPPARPWTGPQGHTSVTGYTRAAGVPGRNLIGCVPDRNRIVYPVAIPPPPSSPPSHCPTEISSGVCLTEIASCTLSQYRPRHHHPHLTAPARKITCTSSKRKRRAYNARRAALPLLTTTASSRTLLFASGLNYLDLK